MAETDTLSGAIEQLRNEGYTEDFNLTPECLECSGKSIQLHPDDFSVDKYYRVEGSTDPADEAVVYAISAPSHGLKGVLVNSYGIYSDGVTDNLLNKLKSAHGH